MISPGYIRDKNLAKKHIEKTRKNNSIHPSALHECARKIYLDMIEEPNPPTINKQVVGNLRKGVTGISTHSRILHDLGAYVLEDEVILNIVDSCNGRIDAIIGTEDSKQILEIKTVNNKRYRAMKQLNKPEKKMELQIVYYMSRLGLPGWLYIENKDTQEYMEFFYPTWKIPILAEVEEKILLINSCLEEKVLPPVNITRNCKWCQWKEKYCGI